MTELSLTLPRWDAKVRARRKPKKPKGPWFRRGVIDMVLLLLSVVGHWGALWTIPIALRAFCCFEIHRHGQTNYSFKFLVLFILADAFIVLLILVGFISFIVRVAGGGVGDFQNGSDSPRT